MAPSPAPHERASSPLAALPSCHTNIRRPSICSTAWFPGAPSPPSGSGPTSQRHDSSSPCTPVAAALESSPSGSQAASSHPEIVIKTEPGSPSVPALRLYPPPPHRFRTLDEDWILKNEISSYCVSTSNNFSNHPPMTPKTAKPAQPHHISSPTSGGPMAPPPLPSPVTLSLSYQGHSREYKSAEEAQQDLAGGGPALLPNIVHYRYHKPSIPPSPAPVSRPSDPSRSASKRRTRAEYEDGIDPPLGHGPTATRRDPSGAGGDSYKAQQQENKKEFLRLCERAWDLFHS